MPEHRVCYCLDWSHAICDRVPVSGGHSSCGVCEQVSRQMHFLFEALMTGACSQAAVFWVVSGLPQ